MNGGKDWIETGRSAGRPGEAAAAEHMNVKVRDALACQVAGVDDYSITSFGYV